IILLSSVVQPNFWWLLAITVLFGWMSLVGVVRAEFLRTRNFDVWCVLVVLIGYGIIGFVDDYRKVVRKDTKGLIARWKYFWMSV
ncbi:hypothetical protein ONJ45_25485, partial [Salmonella enterica subsp. enterica serovar Virginia]|nr:hypothetical protein [Salmonella enterica subsp. enterica serovar Virginia]